jgi:hypothetical protein
MLTVTAFWAFTVAVLSKLAPDLLRGQAVRPGSSGDMASAALLAFSSASFFLNASTGAYASRSLQGSAMRPYRGPQASSGATLSGSMLPVQLW